MEHKQIILYILSFVQYTEKKCILDATYIYVLKCCAIYKCILNIQHYIQVCNILHPPLNPTQPNLVKSIQHTVIIFSVQNKITCCENIAKLCENWLIFKWFIIYNPNKYSDRQANFKLSHGNEIKKRT